MEAPARKIAFEPIRSRRAFEEICERIRDQLAAGALKPGDKLPAERELAVQLGVGRNAVREALRTLEFAGVVELRKGVKGGAFIREGDPGSMTRAMQDLMHLGSISLRELTEARLYIQDTVVRLACERATRADLEALAANVEATEKVTLSGEYVARLESSREFYRLLAAASHNAALCLIVDSLTDILMKYLHARVAAGARLKPDLVQARRRFLELLASRDAEAAALEMRTHLQAVHRLLTGETAEVGAVIGDTKTTRTASRRRAGSAA
ncbi:MAG TPA: GntR family transcriptional regulator [Burkholderiaceae bacterium]|nr:GntR family transcriptional regulator [Burkholderiaceae bacterium]